MYAIRLKTWLLLDNYLWVQSPQVTIINLHSSKSEGSLNVWFYVIFLPNDLEWSENLAVPSKLRKECDKPFYRHTVLHIDRMIIISIDFSTQN